MLDGEIHQALHGKSYFGKTCASDNSFMPDEYCSYMLLGGSMSWTVDMSQVGCNCASTVHLVPMHLNSQPGSCSGDYYCDANAVCGNHCAELDMMEVSVTSPASP